jgi:hypothetical protein
MLLTSSSGKDYEIKDLVVGIDMFESLTSPYIKCEVSIIDAANFIETAPIIGQEKVKLRIKDLNSNVTINRQFYISTINDYTKGNAQSAMYILKLVTPEYMMNSLTLVSQSFTGTINSSIERIVVDYLKGKMNLNEQTNGNYKVIIPNWNAFKAIDWLTRRALSSKGYPFAFYETLHDGFKLESYESIFAKKVVTKYVHRGSSTAKDDVDNKAALMSTALRYDIVEMSNTGKNIMRGAFGQGMHVVDHASKSYNFKTYDYEKDFAAKPRLEKFPYIIDTFKVNDKKINEYDAMHSIAYKNSLAYGNINNYNNHVEFSKLQADPLVYQLGMVKVNMTVKGRADISVGKVIEFEVERNKPVAGNTPKNNNEYLSGKFIVQNIHHKMEDGKYYIIMDVVKESLGKKVK